MKEREIEEIYLPPNSPELNPIEEVFGWLKRKLRYKMIRERNELEKEIEKLVTEINKKGVINYYRNSY